MTNETRIETYDAFIARLNNLSDPYDIFYLYLDAATIDPDIAASLSREIEDRSDDPRFEQAMDLIEHGYLRSSLTGI